MLFACRLPTPERSPSGICSVVATVCTYSQLWSLSKYRIGDNELPVKAHLESANIAIVRFVVTGPSLLVRGAGYGWSLGYGRGVQGLRRIHMGSIRRIPFI
jgi:hypothetical protein